MKLRQRAASADAVRELVNSAFATRYYDLDATLKAASAAAVLAEEKADELPPDLIAAAWTEFGNALRIAGRFEDADRALERATALPVLDPPTRIHLLEVKASLCRHTGRFEEAVRLLHLAIQEERETGNNDAEARHYNHLGIVCLDSGERAKALEAFHTALNLLGPDAPPDVVASTGHNLVETLIADGRLSAAASALILLEPFHRHLTSARLSAKAQWLRAKLCRAMNQPSAAKLAYERAYDLLSTEPRSPELAELAREMSEI